MHKGWRDGTAGRVYSLKSGGQLQPIMHHDAITLPNGMAWDVQKRVMFFADTGGCLACMLARSLIEQHQNARILDHEEANIISTTMPLCAAANAIFSYQTDAGGVPLGGERQTAFKTDDPPGMLCCTATVGRAIACCV